MFRFYTWISNSIYFLIYSIQFMVLFENLGECENKRHWRQDIVFNWPFWDVYTYILELNMYIKNRRNMRPVTAPDIF